MDSPGVLNEVASFVVGASIEKMPDEVLRKAKECVIDCLGCMLAGCMEDGVGAAVWFGEVMGGNSRATVIGRGTKTSPYYAALANGIAAHVMDYDDVSRSMMGHPSVVILPAVLAAGEDIGISGKQLLESYIVGVEVAAALGRGLNPLHYGKGWHATSTIGIFGAAAAVCKILNIPLAQVVNALAMAASEASGIKANFGTMTKSFHAGHAAAKGLMAAYLASRGFTANSKAFEADLGFGRVTTGEIDVDRVTRSLGNPYEFMEPGIYIKLYPSCQGTHNAIDAMLCLANEHDLRPEQVRRISCFVQPITRDLLPYSRPRTGLEAKFSIQACVALALTERSVRLQHFTDERVREDAFAETMSKIEMSVDPEIAGGSYFKGTWDTIVKVVLRDGREFTKRVDIAKGDPRNPLTDEELVLKYRDCAGRVMSEERIVNSIRALNSLESISKIQDLIRALVVRAE